ncbi:MAG: class II aldolase/adducin family protein [Chlamydiota bacterium]
MKSEREYRQDIVEVCRRMYARGYISGSDGNVSVRLGSNRMLSTPSGINKGFLSPRDLIVTDMRGAKLQGEGKPTGELYLHIEAYQRRPDIGAVVHAHPPLTIAFSLAGLKLPQCVLPEIVMIFGSIPMAAYATPCTEEGPQAIASLIGDCDALIIERHGTITVGDNVFTAYDRLEKVEHSAEVCAAARQLGPVKPLPREEIAKLLDLREKLGLKSKVYPCNKCGMCEPKGNPAQPPDGLVEALSAELYRTIREKL